MPIGSSVAVDGGGPASLVATAVVEVDVEGVEVAVAVGFGFEVEVEVGVGAGCAQPITPHKHPTQARRFTP